MYYNGGYGYGYNDGVVRSASNLAGAGIWMIIASLIALVGGIIAYYLFIKPDKKVNGSFLNKLREFLRFRIMLIEGLLKAFYVIGAIFVTLSSFCWFALGFIGILPFLLQLTLGNVVTRVLYEAMLIKVMIWKNTKEICDKVK